VNHPLWTVKPSTAGSRKAIEWNRMRYRLLIGALITVAAVRGAETNVPSSLYVVSAFFSDDGPEFYYRVIDVRKEGQNYIVRYSRVATVNLYCPRRIVQSVDAKLPRPPSKLVKSSNPCTIKPNELDAAVKKYARSEGVLEAISFGVVAQCGGSEVVLRLPISQNVDLVRLRRANSSMAGLWDLASAITDSAFGSKDVFHDRTDAEDLVLQRTGERVVPQLISGEYDAGLAAAVQGNVGSWKTPKFRDLLADYRGPVSAEEAKTGFVPQLLEAGKYQFSRFVVPKYPPLAMLARIQGNVELRLILDLDTGQVLEVEAVSGHPLLKPSAIEAAKQWRIEPKSITSQGLNLTVQYALRCP
jgi:TonB family protein